MSLTLIYGDRGSGKSLFATIMALRASEKNQTPIYANYKMNIDTWKPLSPRVILEIPLESIIIIDEGYLWLESRTSSKGMNIYLSRMLFQSRKRHIDIWVIMQLFSSVDLRFREMADYLVQCVNDKEEEKFKYRITKTSQTRRFNDKILELTYDDASKFFNFFDTDEIIDPLDNDLEDMAITNWSELDEELTTNARILLKKKLKWTQAGVEDWCNRNGKGKNYAKRLFNRINYLS